MIAVSWAMSAAISVPPLFGWRQSVSGLTFNAEESPSLLSSIDNSTWNIETITSASGSFPTNRSLAWIDINDSMARHDGHSGAKDTDEQTSRWNIHNSTVQRQLFVSVFRTMFRNSSPSTTTSGAEIIAAKTTACHVEKLPQIKHSITNHIGNSPQFNGTTSGGRIMLHPAFECLISQDIGYTVFSTVGAFYLPLAFISVVYLNVYRVARSRIHRKQFNIRKQRYHRAGDDDRPSGRASDMSSVNEQPEKESSRLRVFGGLRAKLSSSSAVTIRPTTTYGTEFSTSPMTKRRTTSFNNGSLGSHRQKTNSMPSSSAVAANRSSGTTGTNQLLQPLVPASTSSQPQQQQQPQLVVAQSASRQYLSVDASPRLSESSSPASSPSSSRGGSWIYLTR